MILQHKTGKQISTITDTSKDPLRYKSCQLAFLKHFNNNYKKNKKTILVGQREINSLDCILESTHLYIYIYIYIILNNKTKSVIKKNESCALEEEHNSLYIYIYSFKYIQFHSDLLQRKQKRLKNVKTNDFHERKKVKCMSICGAIERHFMQNKVFHCLAELNKKEKEKRKTFPSPIKFNI